MASDLWWDTRLKTVTVVPEEWRLLVVMRYLLREQAKKAWGWLILSVCPAPPHVWPWVILNEFLWGVPLKLIFFNKTACQNSKNIRFQNVIIQEPKLYCTHILGKQRAINGNQFILFYFLFFQRYQKCQRFRWSRGSVLAFSTQVRGFKPGRSPRIFGAKKILSMPSFGGK